MQKFIITEQQLLSILTQLSELPLKAVLKSFDILRSLQPIDDKKQEKPAASINIKEEQDEKISGASDI